MGAAVVNICARIAYFLVFLKIVAAFLNIEEINSVNYGIDILNKPVLSGQVASGSVMYLKSRFGQEYQCNLPEVILPSDEARLADDPSATAEVDIAELLRPLEEAPCLVKMKDWWTYEFCYGKFIRQYHMEDNKILSPEIFLGHYESEYDWKNDTKQEENSHNRLQRYHSQYYVNGTRCDVTGTLRKAEVRFLCEEGSGNYIARVDEPESCRYILTIHTAHVCHHPYLRPPPSNKPQPVTCNPVLTAEQYEEYLIEEEESKREAEEQRWKWLAQQEERLEQLKKKKAEKSLSSTEVEDKSASDSDAEIEEPEDLSSETKTSTTSSNDKVNTLAGPISKEDTTTHDSEHSSGKGVENVKSGKDEEAESSKPLSLEDQFTEIMEEAEEELNENLAKEDGDSFNHLAATLNKLMKKLDRAEQDINQASRTLEKFQQKIDTQSSIGSFPVALKSSDIQKAADAETTPDKEEPDDLVKVRVTHSSSSHNRGKQLQEKAVDETHRHQLEKVIRQKLEQSGLDTTGRKIEVKIITAEYPGNDEDPNIAVLSEEETQQFQHLIITFLAGNQEAAEQMERQQRLEENYRFVWGQGKHKTEAQSTEPSQLEEKEDERSD